MYYCKNCGSTDCCERCDLPKEPVLCDKCYSSEMEKLMSIDNIIEHCNTRVSQYESADKFKDTDLSDMENTFAREYREHKQVGIYLQELLRYRKMKEQGLLVELPCKVGDKVYKLIPNEVVECREEEVTKIILIEDTVWICFKDGLPKKIEQIGDVIFLTREEAENAISQKKI